MSRVEDKTTTADRVETARTEAEQLDTSLDVLAPLDMLSGEQLATLVSIVRRPPELPITRVRENQYALLDAKMTAEMEPLAGVSTGEFALSVIELLLRRREDIDTSDDPGATEGLANLEEFGRLCEHLYLSQIGSGGH